MGEKSSSILCPHYNAEAAGAGAAAAAAVIADIAAAVVSERGHRTFSPSSA